MAPMGCAIRQIARILIDYDRANDIAIIRDCENTYRGHSCVKGIRQIGAILHAKAVSAP